MFLLPFGTAVVFAFLSLVCRCTKERFVANNPTKLVDLVMAISIVMFKVFDITSGYHEVLLFLHYTYIQHVAAVPV